MRRTDNPTGTSVRFFCPSRRVTVLVNILLFFIPATLFAQTALPKTSQVIRGRIVDALSGLPVHFVSITLVEIGRETVTDRDGRFVIRDLDPGLYTLHAIRDGYEPLTQRGLDVGAGDEVTLDLSMTRVVIELETIVVTPGAFTFMDPSGTTSQTMTREDIESVPQLGADIFRAVNRLPGLSSGDYSAHFSIRGGRHDETLILLDGLELYEPYHLKDFNEGAISIIDSETIERVGLMTGGFPAKYGNKRSGVFDITTRTPKLDRPRYSAGVSFINARASAMGPLADGRGAWVVSARSGYLDLVFNIIKQNDLPSPRYHDVFTKFQFDLNTEHSLSVNGLHAGDKYTFNAAATTGFRDTSKTMEDATNQYGNSYMWSTLSSKLGDRTKVNTMGFAGLVTRNRDGSERYINLTEPIYSLTNERDFSILGIKQDWTHGFWERYVVEFGADLRRFKNTDRFTSIVGQDPNDPTEDPTGAYPVTTNTSIDNRNAARRLPFQPPTSAQPACRGRGWALRPRLLHRRQ